MTNNWFKSPLVCVISPLTQPQVANQQKNEPPKTEPPKTEPLIDSPHPKDGPKKLLFQVKM